LNEFINGIGTKLAFLGNRAHLVDTILLDPVAALYPEFVDSMHFKYSGHLNVGLNAG